MLIYQPCSLSMKTGLFYKRLTDNIMMDRYWTVNIYKDGVLKKSFECEDDNDVLRIAEDARKRGFDIEIEGCSRIKDFIESVYEFIKDNY